MRVVIVGISVAVLDVDDDDYYYYYHHHDINALDRALCDLS